MGVRNSREKENLHVQSVHVFQTYVFFPVIWTSFKCFTHCKNTRVITLSHSFNNRNVNAMFNNHFNGRPTITAPQTQLIKLWLNIDWISNLVWLMLLYISIKSHFKMLVWLRGHTLNGVTMNYNRVMMIEHNLLFKLERSSGFGG